MKVTRPFVWSLPMGKEWSFSSIDSAVKPCFLDTMVFFSSVFKAVSCNLRSAHL